MDKRGTNLENNRERKNRKKITTRGKRRNRNEGMGGIF